MKKLLVIAAVMLCAFSACKKEELPQGSIDAKFSVSDFQKVIFSKGNLQYNAVEKCWRFAEHQYDFIGEANEKIGPDYEGWIDLFGWGTSGYLQGPVCYFPDNYYQPQYESGMLNLNYENGAEWGVNRIINGGDQWDMWNTLRVEQWKYLLHYREGAHEKCAQAKVDGIHGLVILPDEWVQPAEVSFATEGVNWGENHYTPQEWQVMESAGAVFLPAAGYRMECEVLKIGDYGQYWSSSAYDMHNASCMIFYNSSYGNYGVQDQIHKSLGLSVRLVHYCE